MKTPRICSTFVIVICSVAALAACAPSGSTSGSTTGNGTPSVAVTVTATAKPAPTAVPPVTLAFCQQILSLAEANQIMQPAKPAITIDVTPVPNGGQCTYFSPPLPAGLVLGIRLATYTGTRPIPEQNIETYFEQGLGQPGVTVLASSPVSGVGDQAGIVVGSYTLEGTTAYGAAFYVLYGNIVFFCGNVYSSSPTASQQSALKQCAQFVVSRL